jgi:hypothetical protein
MEENAGCLSLMQHPILSFLLLVQKKRNKRKAQPISLPAGRQGCGTCVRLNFSSAEIGGQ